MKKRTPISYNPHPPAIQIEPHAWQFQSSLTDRLFTVNHLGGGILICDCLSPYARCSHIRQVEQLRGQQGGAQ